MDIMTLCQLTEMEDIRPSTVLELVPGTSRAQMGAFLQIAEDLKNKVMGGGRNKAHKAPRKDAVPKTDKPISVGRSEGVKQDRTGGG